MRTRQRFGGGSEWILSVWTGVIEKEEAKMAGEDLRWRHSLEEARQEARSTGKSVLIDLFNPG